VPGGATPRRYWPIDRPGPRGAAAAPLPQSQARWDGWARRLCGSGWPPKAAPPSRRVRPHASIALDRDHHRTPASCHAHDRARVSQSRVPVTSRAAVPSPCPKAPAVPPWPCMASWWSAPLAPSAEGSGQGSQGGKTVSQSGQASLHHSAPLKAQGGSAPLVAGAQGSGERGEGGQAVGQTGQAALQLRPPTGREWAAPLGLLAGDGP
jgi:hypothetical protein